MKTPIISQSDSGEGSLETTNPAFLCEIIRLEDGYLAPVPEGHEDVTIICKAEPIRAVAFIEMMFLQEDQLVTIDPVAPDDIKR